MKPIHLRYLEYHDRILRWQRAMGQDVNSPGQSDRQWGYCQSEWVELLDAMRTGNLVEYIDGIGDVLFTALGMPSKEVIRMLDDRNTGLLLVVEMLCLVENWDQFEILEAVCQSNETKFWETVDGVDLAIHTVHSADNGKFVVRRKSDNKVTKPPTFKLPDFSAIIHGPTLVR
jgi:hypothetical protein